MNEPSVEQSWETAVEAELQQQTEQASSTIPEQIQEADTATTSPTPSPTDEIVKAILSQLEPRLADLKEENRRLRQSVRDTSDSVIKRVNQQLAQQSVGLDYAVTQGLVSPEEASRMKRDLRDRIETQAIQQPPVASDETARLTQSMLEEIWESSNLTDADPEAREINHNLSALSPYDAIRQYRRDVQQAIEKKNQRLRTTSKPKAPPAVMVDMGGGSGAQLRTAEAVLAELNAELAKPNSDDKKIIALTNALDQIARTNK